MKFVSFRNAAGEVRAGWLQEDGVVDMALASQGRLPSSMMEFLQESEQNLRLAQELHNSVKATHALAEVRLTSPLPRPSTFRDFVGFETHFTNAKRKFSEPIPQEWYQIAAFYFGNPNTFVGPDEPVKRPGGCERMDYELELACIIGKAGSDIKAENADDHIFGYAILNDWTARDLQLPEIRIGLGMAKGKDFATSMGPYIVTKDELAPYRDGDRYDLEMKAYRNGKLMCSGNYKTVYYSFGQMIERASANVTLYPGDVLASGTVGYGTILEVGAEEHGWIQPGDVIEFTITGLGTLRNKVV